MYDTFFPGKDGEYLTLKRRFFAKEMLPLPMMLCGKVRGYTITWEQAGFVVENEIYWE